MLGFIGFCGVLWIGGDPSGPGWLQWLAGGLVLLALALACLAIYLVGRVAYPLHDPADAGPSAMAGAARRLRAGIRVTYLAVVVLVVATLSGWWPHVAGTGLVEARAATGQVWCGAVVDAPAGAVALDTADGPVTLLLDQISTLRPVDEC